MDITVSNMMNPHPVMDEHGEPQQDAAFNMHSSLFLMELRQMRQNGMQLEREQQRSRLECENWALYDMAFAAEQNSENGCGDGAGAGAGSGNHGSNGIGWPWSSYLRSMAYFVSGATLTYLGVVMRRE